MTSFRHQEGQVRRICHEEEINVQQYQVLTREIEPTLKPLEEIIQENVFCLGVIGTMFSHVFVMLYSVVHSEKFNLAYYMAKRIVYVLYDRVMTPLAAQLERKPRKDRGTRRGRHSTSSSTFNEPSSSNLNDDDDDGNNEGTSCASTPSPIHVPPRPLNPQPLQSHPSLDITFSLSPITPLDHTHDTLSPPSPPQPQPAIMGHSHYYNYNDYHAPWMDNGAWEEPTPVRHHFGNILRYQDLEWHEALKDSKLKEEALKNKVIMEGMIDEDKESSNEGWRRWDDFENTDRDNEETENEIEHEDEERCEVFDDHERPLCYIRRFEMVKYSFRNDEELFSLFISNRRYRDRILHVFPIFYTGPRYKEIDKVVIMEYLMKISRKARILELKQRNIKNIVLTSNTPYPSRKIRRIYACTSLKTTKDQGSIRQNTDYWQEPNTQESLVEQVATSPTKNKKKATCNRQKRTSQSIDAPRQTPWTTEEEIVLCKGWLFGSENSKDGNAKKQSGFWCEESGAEYEDYIQMAMMHYEIQTEIPFVLRSEGSKRHKSSGSSLFNTESGKANINLNTIIGDTDEDEIFGLTTPGAWFSRDNAKYCSMVRVLMSIPTIAPADLENQLLSVSLLICLGKHDCVEMIPSGDENHIRTLRDYSKPGHKGYMNTIELFVGNNMVPLRFDTIRLVQNICSFHGLRSEDPNQHLKDFLKLVDPLDLNGENKERTRSITTWEDLTTRFLTQCFSPGRTAKLRNDIQMFQQHHG
uniref:Zinc finger, CCHC-type n=1 Tax=Tanacetum cinerariifolium TaxID=118510 RepID=A0A6L2LFN0_TANCI|nr:zinc finger, CCHC-type [Tanacetum cinerariifolium]